MIRQILIAVADRTGLGTALRDLQDCRWLANPRVTEDGILFCGAPAYMKWPEDERIAFQQHLQHCDLLIDVGANIGQYTCAALAAGKRVIAVEPLRRNLQFLYRNIEINGFTDVEIFPLAVGDAPGIASISGLADVASLVPNWSRTAALHRESVSVTTLDILVGERFAGANILLKIDVEGFEHRVLAGADALLSRTPRPVLMLEMFKTFPNTSAPNPDYNATMERLVSLGYRGTALDGSPINAQTQNMVLMAAE